MHSYLNLRHDKIMSKHILEALRERISSPSISTMSFLYTIHAIRFDNNDGSDTLGMPMHPCFRIETLQSDYVVM